MWLAPDEQVARSFRQRLICLERDKQLQGCVRPKTYPKLPKNAHLPTYTDYYER